jgi:hypothetical protein
MEWIKIKDKLPRARQIYWAYPTSMDKGFVALYWDGKEFIGGKFRPKNITHYREIGKTVPEAPNE